jgi:zinc protease
MPRRTLAAALLLAAAPLPAQTPDLAAPLPPDPAVLTGLFPNGLRYFVRRNSRPEKRAELRLVVNAGSVLEDDNQLGLAHFVEHMAFNGTRRFPKADIVNFLERVGMRFGADVNAYTSFDETVYMLTIPTDSARLVATAFDILEDWAHGVTFDAEEVRKERGVVVEEWRTGRNASTRVAYRQFPVLLHGSRYAVRIPIGTRENLETFPDSLAVKFYRDWYRPDLMTVVAVGDFDPQAIVRHIEERFSRIPLPASPRPRVFADVPDHVETLVSIEADRELPGKSVSLLWLKPRTEVRSVADWRRDLVTRFYDQMLNLRFGEIAQRPDAPFASAASGRGDLVRTKGMYQMNATVKESDFTKAAEALLAEAERVRRFGFVATELDRRRTQYLRSLEQAWAERDKSESWTFANQYVDAALTGEPVVSIEKEFELGRALVPGITLDEVNGLARTTLADSNRVVLVSAPERPDVKLPTAPDMLALFDRAKSLMLTAFVDSTSDAPLVPQPPAPGRVVTQRILPGTGIIEWRLSNGAKVLLKPTDFKADEVLFYAHSPGGSSLFSDADAFQMSLGTFALASGGLGDFNSMALQKKLTGRRASVSASVGEVNEVMSGRASSRDLETMFQLAWLRATRPRVDSQAYRAFANQIKAALSNQQNQPGSVFNDTITVTMAQHHPRVRLFKPDLLDSVNLPRVLQLYRERFADVSDFTFILVGAFQPDSARPLVERWLASLPALNRRERPRDNGVRPPPGVVTKVVHKGIEPKATTQVIFTGPCTYSYANRQVIHALNRLLDIRLREVLREDKGGTYGVSVSGTCNHIPYSRYRFMISFGSAPERAEEMVNAAWAVIDSVKMGFISDSNLTKIREMTVREHETALKENAAWLDAIRDADEDGRDYRDWLRTPELFGKVTREHIRDAARQYLRREQVARFTLLPEQPKTVP